VGTSAVTSTREVRGAGILVGAAISNEGEATDAGETDIRASGRAESVGATSEIALYFF
jgi:hypothetical protein